MEFALKLKSARAEVEELLKRYDIVGHFVLCAPHNAEAGVCLEASWSKLRMEAAPEGGVIVRLRSHHEEYGGDLERQQRELEASVCVPAMMWPILAQAAMSMQELSEELDEVTGATHTPLTKADD